MDIEAYAPVRVMWVPRLIQMATDGAAAAISRATRTICSTGISVMAEAHSGVRSLTSRFHQATRPWVCSSLKAGTSVSAPRFLPSAGSGARMTTVSGTVSPGLKRFTPSAKSPTKVLYQRPSARMTCAKASASALSVPFLIGSQVSALEAARDRRGSTTVILPLSIILPHILVE